MIIGFVMLHWNGKLCPFSQTLVERSFKLHLPVPEFDALQEVPNVAVPQRTTGGRFQKRITFLV